MIKKGKAGLLVALIFLSGMIVYRFFSKEVTLYEKEIDNHGHRVMVTCRPEKMLVYYPYVVVKAPNDLEVARSQISRQGYEWFNACKNSFPVNDLILLDRRNGVRLYLHGRNAFGDAEYIDVPISFFPS
ncbi:MAG TPA: hypothetical protein VJS44_19550 [Pyrinomonadaceae bacterium]|nr:hypothetical protein [Pyrinomonadaceae bacterium]